MVHAEVGDISDVDQGAKGGSRRQSMSSTQFVAVVVGLRMDHGVLGKSFCTWVQLGDLVVERYVVVVLGVGIVVMLMLMVIAGRQVFSCDHGLLYVVQEGQKDSVEVSLVLGECL